MKAYEGLFILDSAGKEEGSKDLVDKIQKEIELAGGRVETVQKMGMRSFARLTQKRSAGFYVNYLFQAPPSAIAALDAKFHLEPEIFRWQFLEVVPVKERKKKKKKAVAKTAKD